MEQPSLFRIRDDRAEAKEQPYGAQKILPQGFHVFPALKHLRQNAFLSLNFLEQYREEDIQSRLNEDEELQLFVAVATTRYPALPKQAGEDLRRMSLRPTEVEHGAVVAMILCRVTEKFCMLLSSISDRRVDAAVSIGKVIIKLQNELRNKKLSTLHAMVHIDDYYTKEVLFSY